MKKITRQVSSFECEICGTKYRSEKKALECEARKMEELILSVGDTVLVRVVHTCEKNMNKHFSPSGVVEKIIGPILPNEEEEIKWIAPMLASDRKKASTSKNSRNKGKGGSTEKVIAEWIDHFNSPRLDMHIYEFGVSFTCPHCGKKRGGIFYQPQLPKTDEVARSIIAETDPSTVY